MPRKVTKNLSHFRILFFREKYRFDQGNAFLVFVNFSLLVATLVNQSGGQKEAIKTYVIMGLLGTWFLGFILDRVIKVQDAQERISLKRSPIWQENFQHHETLQTQLQELNNQLKSLETKLALATVDSQLKN